MACSSLTLQRSIAAKEADHAMQLPLILALALNAPLIARQDNPSSHVREAESTFAALDKNQDKQISAAEYAAFSTDRQPFQTADGDGNGLLDRDEFLLFYRSRLISAQKKPTADLEAEATRIQAARRAKQSASGPADQRRRVAPAAPAGPAAPAAEATGIEQGLKAALEALDARAAQGKATAEDVQAVRNQLIARARAAANTAANTPVANPNALAEERALQAKWLQSLERMEAAAREGKFSREEFTQFREELNRRLRQQANEAQQQSQPAPAPLPASPQQPAERPKPEAQPAPAPQPQPQPQPQPESRPQPQPEPQPRARPTPAPAPEPQPQPEPQRPPQRPKPGG
jgi:hypothetical protein